MGIDRLLKLYEKYNIKCKIDHPLRMSDRNSTYITDTFFTPAHTLESFPEQLAKVRDAGHELGLHGYTHEYISALPAKEQKAVLTKSIAVLTDFCGKKPQGYTAPAWTTSKELIPQLEEAGIVYDHSFMHHDVQPYWAPDSSHTWIETDVKKEAAQWMSPMTKLKPSGVVEIPANWHVDDWPPLQPKGPYGYVDTHVVERMWREQFDFAYREYDTFIFPMSIHPQVSGKPQVILMHERYVLRPWSSIRVSADPFRRLIEHINSHEGVEWMPLGEMAEEFRSGRFPGVKVEGGADVKR